METSARTKKLCHGGRISGSIPRQSTRDTIVVRIIIVNNWNWKNTEMSFVNVTYLLVYWQHNSWKREKLQQPSDGKEASLNSNKLIHLWIGFCRLETIFCWKYYMDFIIQGIRMKFRAPFTVQSVSKLTKVSHTA